MKTEGSLEAQEAFQHYFGLSARAHRIDTHNLNQTNADVVSGISIILIAQAFANIESQPLTPSNFPCLNPSND